MTEATEPTVIICPDWCERGQEHCDETDTEHWSAMIDISGGMSVDLSVNAGRPQLTLHSGDFVKIAFMPPEAAKLIAALTHLLAEAAETYPKHVVLDD